MCKKLRTFLLLSLVVAHVSYGEAFEVRDDGVTFTSSDGYAMLGASISGSVTYGLLHLLNPAAIQRTRDRLFIAGAVALMSGGITYMIASYIHAKKQTKFENYSRARDTFETASHHVFTTEPLENLPLFVKERCGVQKPFAHALQEVEKMEKELQDAQISLGTVIETTRFARSSRDKRLVAESKKLLQEIQGLYDSSIRERKTVIAHEADLEERVIHYVWLCKEIDAILSSEQMRCVNASYTQTIAYGVTGIDELWPLILVIRELRKTVGTINHVHTLCIEQKTICFEKGKTDERYTDLGQKFHELSVKIENEFPFSLFEQRVQEIMTSNEYKEQSKLYDGDRKHKAQMERLNELQGEVKKLDTSINEIKQNVSRLRHDVAQSKDDLVDVKHEVRRMRNDANWNHWNRQ